MKNKHIYFNRFILCANRIIISKIINVYSLLTIVLNPIMNLIIVNSVTRVIIYLKTDVSFVQISVKNAKETMKSWIVYNALMDMRFKVKIV